MIRSTALRSLIALLGAIWCVVAVGADVAEAQRPDPGVVESEVWSELPTQLVAGRADMAMASFATRDQATSIRFRAVGGEIRLSRIELVYRDNSTQVLDIRNVLGAGELTGPISLPQSTLPLKDLVVHVLATSPLGDERRIATFASGGRATAGKSAAQATPRGWVPIGLRRTTFGQDREIISIGRDRGRFVGLALRPRDGGIVLKELRIVYANGEAVVAALSKQIDQDMLTPPLKVSSEQTIHEVQVRFDAIAGLGSTRPLLELLGAYDPDYIGNQGSVVAVNGGWLLLGLQTAAQFKTDGDYVLSGDAGQFTRLRVIPRNGDAEIRDLHLTLSNGAPIVVPVNQILRAGRPSPLIELPRTTEGEKLAITSVTINRKGRSQLRGDTIIEVWGQY